jgi:hypothetical protein
MLDAEIRNLESGMPWSFCQFLKKTCYHQKWRVEMNSTSYNSNALSKSAYNLWILSHV